MTWAYSTDEFIYWSTTRVILTHLYITPSFENNGCHYIDILHSHVMHVKIKCTYVGAQNIEFIYLPTQTMTVPYNLQKK